MAEENGRKNGKFAASIVFMVFSLLFFAIFLFFSISLISIGKEENNIGKAMGLIFFIGPTIFSMIPFAVFDGLWLGFSIALLKKEQGGRKKYAVVSIVLSALCLVTSLILLMVSLLSL